MQKASIYLEANNKSPRKMKRRYGYVLECEHAGGLKTKEFTGEIEETYHGTMVAALESAMVRFRKPCEIMVHAADTWLLDMLENQLSKWADGNFLNAHGKPIAYQKQWLHIWVMSAQHEIYGQRGSHTYSEWLQRKMEES